MHINKVIKFTEIDIAKEYVVEDMLQLWNGGKKTLVISHSSETYTDNLLKMISDINTNVCIDILYFNNRQELLSNLAGFNERSYQSIVSFNSLHLLSSLIGIDHLLANLLDIKGTLHLSWPAKSLLKYPGEITELDIAKMVSSHTCQPFDQLRKSDQSYLSAFPSFHCQRMSKFDFNLNFSDIASVRNWHKCGSDFLFGAENTKAQEKNIFYAKLFKYAQLSRYHARMTTTVADFRLN